MESHKINEYISGRYRILKVLGQGGMGTVYQVADSLLDNSLFALKTIRYETLQKNPAKRIRI